MYTFTLLGNVPWALVLPVAFILWQVGLTVYRRYFHPLAHVPGPFLASISDLYLMYFNATDGSKFYKQLDKLHAKYGPVVRIKPNEVHLSDPDNYDKIYNVGSRYTKDMPFYRAFGTDASVFSTTSNDLHRIRRAALNPLFSRKRVLELEDLVHEKAGKLDARLRRAAGGQESVDLHHGLRSVSVDVITDYAFDSCYNLLDREDMGLEYFIMIRQLGPAIWFFQFWPWLQPMAKSLPIWLAGRLNSNLTGFLTMQSDCLKEIIAVKKKIDAGEEKADRTTIFHQLLDPNASEGHVVPSIEHLNDEAFVILAAASETTGNALSVTMYHVISNPAIYAKLSVELNKAFPNPDEKLDFVTLEQLPYLTAVVKEGLRLSYGVIGRLPRVVPEPGAEFNGVHIPEGATVGMSAWTMHRNPNLFPDPDTFDPERWLDPDDAHKLDKYLVAFSKGSRQCIGMPLAYCEIYVTLGTLFRRHQNLETYLSSRDLEYEDYFSPFRPMDAKKFCVTSKP